MKQKSKEEVDLLIVQLRESIQDVFASNEMFDNDFYLYRWLLHNNMKVDRTRKLIREDNPSLNDPYTDKQPPPKYLYSWEPKAISDKIKEHTLILRDVFFSQQLKRFFGGGFSGVWGWIVRSIEWRKVNGVEELANADWGFGIPGLKYEIYYYFGGLTKTGQPVTTVNGEDMDTRTLVQKYGKDALVRFGIQSFAKHEKLLLEHYKHGPTINSDIPDNDNHNSERNAGGNFQTGYNPSWYSAAPVHIVSYKNYSLLNATCLEGLQVHAEVARIGLAYFPALVSTLYIVNLNKFSNLVVKMLKPLIQSECFTVEFFDTNKTKWTKELLKHIDADQLHPYFGGTKFIPNEFCIN